MLDAINGRMSGTVPVTCTPGNFIISLKVRHRALPRHLKDIQFARTIGKITAAANDLSGFTIKTLRDTDVTFGVSANTIYYDVDAGAAGSFTASRASSARAPRSSPRT